MSRPVKPVRVITVNMCIAASGLQNRILPKLCLFGGWLFGPPLFFTLTYLTYCSLLEQQERTRQIRGFPLDKPYDPVSTTAALALTVYAPLAVAVGFILGIQGGRILGVVNTLWTGRQDFKRERIRDTMRVCKDYDVILVQECYAGAPFVIDPNYPRFLSEEARQYGFEHVAFAGKPVLPSCCLGTGLMIVSKHKILESTTLSFEAQYMAEYFGVNRGAMHARILVEGEEEAMDLFTLHTTASVREALLKGAPEFLLAAADTTRLKQFEEMKSFVETKREEGSACVVAGDFNANVKLTGGKMDRGNAIDAVLESMVKGLGFKDLGWKVTYGYVPNDKVLTNANHPEGTEVTEDLIFIDPKTTAASKFESVLLLADEKGKERGYTHLSDHIALAVVVEGKGWGKGKGGKEEVEEKAATRRRGKRSPARGGKTLVRRAASPATAKSPVAVGGSGGRARRVSSPARGAGVRSSSRRAKSPAVAAPSTPVQAKNAFRALEKRIAVYSEMYDKYCPGVVGKTFDPKGRVEVSYDDGDFEIIDLKTEQWHYL
jgi:endonuclease/exonuclease/phosphatase family metal-dependent hydrolase